MTERKLKYPASHVSEVDPPGKGESITTMSQEEILGLATQSLVGRRVEKD